MYLVQSADLPMRCAMIAETRNCVALQVWFRARILLPGVVGVQVIFRANCMEEITRKLIRLDWSR